MIQLLSKPLPNGKFTQSKDGSANSCSTYVFKTLRRGERNPFWFLEMLCELGVKGPGWEQGLWQAEAEERPSKGESTDVETSRGVWGNRRTPSCCRERARARSEK